MANMSPIYKYLGASDSQIPLLWLAAPLTSFLVQPIIGAMSERRNVTMDFEKLVSRQQRN